MSSSRHSTVFDLTSLRLHADGTRVPQTGSGGYKTAAVRDSRGNWIATDAGGQQVTKRTVKRFRERSKRDEGDGEVFDFSGVDGEVEGRETTQKGKGKEKARLSDEEYMPKGARARKRRKFANDLGFLEASIQEQNPVSDLPIPSSDLLKCIHHFASVYYSERGQLYDASRDYRREKKQRRLQRLKQRAEGSSGSHSEDDDDGGGVEDRRQRTTDEADDSDEEDSQGSRSVTPSTSDEGDVDHSQTEPLRKDMYKIMDGSALMAIGMLLQEHVAKMLSLQMPPGWEGEMLEENTTVT